MLALRFKYGNRQIRELKKHTDRQITLKLIAFTHDRCNHLFLIEGAKMTKSLRPIYYDTETTGIRQDKDRIIELAAFDPVENRTFCQLINPGIPIPKEATAIHNISDEMVAQAPSFKEAAEAFITFCPSETVLIAHNNDAFDKLFIEAEFKRAQVSLPAFRYIDTLKWARKYRSDLPRHTLQSLREVYGFPANQAHRALDDVIVLHQVFSVMIDDLSMEQVIELLAKPQALSRMPFGKHQGKLLAEIPKDYVAWLASSGAFEKPDNQELKESFEKLGLLI
jgi:DNA polymerase-3 subunit epsilon